ncbi:MAG: non-canonical purine NTP pyrophosphatase [Candidatus Paceibacterota bacterium]|jgi:non-canonical purine NTP pyrophosphatase (RdgB/HAM1 family)
MKKLHYITGNRSKFANAQAFFAPYGIVLVQTKLDVYEIQGSDAVAIARSKAEQAWEQLREPLFINDACWIVPALDGFPGPYMKYINGWFAPQDFINLMQNKKDRTIILRDTIAYIDEQGSQVFTNDHRGTILERVYSGGCKNPSDAVISLSKSGRSLAEEMAGKNFFLEGEDVVWNNFIGWLQKNKERP